MRFGRTVARFLTGFDAWLTPTMSTPPLPVGEITSTDDDPWRAARVGGETVGFAGVVANITGNPAMSVPLHWTGDDLPVGVHFLGRFGDEAALFRLAAQLEEARPWAHRWPSVSAVQVAAGRPRRSRNAIRIATSVSRARASAGRDTPAVSR